MNQKQMKYLTKTYPEEAVRIQISSFTGKGDFKNKALLSKKDNLQERADFKEKEGVTEYQLLVSVTDPCLPFDAQLSNLQKGFLRAVQEELDGNAVAVFRRYFLSDAANQADAVTEWECENSFCTLSIVQQPPLNGTKIALWAYLQTDMQIQIHPSGLFEASHNGYRHLWNGNAYNKAANSEYQTRLILNEYVMQLTEQHASLATHCLRTWFFVQNVDLNYEGVVKARKEVFITQNLTEKTHYIASTGIEGRHADPRVLVQMDSYAVDGLQPEQIQYLYAPTHLNPTYEYGVTFERGTAVTYGDRRQIFISGTASIDNRGEIVYPGDILKQAQRMMKNIEALLKEAGADLSDISEAVTYLRDPADYAIVKKFFNRHYAEFPHLIVFAPVCRSGWLIETECMAVIPWETEVYNSL